MNGLGLNDSQTYRNGPKYSDPRDEHEAIAKLSTPAGQEVTENTFPFTVVSGETFRLTYSFAFDQANPTKAYDYYKIEGTVTGESDGQTFAQRYTFIDIFPDFIGYYLAGTALGELSAASDYFEKAKPFAFLLILFSLADFVQTDNLIITTFIPSRENIVFMLIFTVATVLSLFMVYYICQGILERAYRLEAEELGYKARRRWWLFFAVNTLSLGLTPFGLNLPERILIFALILSAIAEIISYIHIIALVSDAEKADWMIP